MGNIFNFGCCSCKQINENDEFIFDDEKNYKTNIRSERNNNKNQNKNTSIFKFKDDDSYNDYVLYLNQIIDITDDENISINNINIISTNNNNKQKEESLN